MSMLIMKLLQRYGTKKPFGIAKEIATRVPNTQRTVTKNAISTIKARTSTAGTAGYGIGRLADDLRA